MKQILWSKKIPLLFQYQRQIANHFGRVSILSNGRLCLFSCFHFVFAQSKYENAHVWCGHQCCLFAAGDSVEPQLMQLCTNTDHPFVWSGRKFLQHFMVQAALQSTENYRNDHSTSSYSVLSSRLSDVYVLHGNIFDGKFPLIALFLKKWEENFRFLQMIRTSFSYYLILDQLKTAN